VVGGLAGKHLAEDVNPSVEETYWRENYASRPYASESTFEEFSPAYRYGWESYGRHAGRRFDDVAELEAGWQSAKGKSQMEWSKAKHASRDAWDRIAHRHQQS
jgi:hypothetical protein